MDENVEKISMKSTGNLFYRSSLGLNLIFVAYYLTNILGEKNETSNSVAAGSLP